MREKSGPIKCIALDLDGTTLDKSGNLSEENKKAIEIAIKKGIHIVIASGRSFYALPKHVLEIKGIEYAITSNGAAIYHVPTQKKLHGFVMEPSSVEQIWKVTQEEDVVCEAFVEGKAHADAAYVKDPVGHGASERAISYIQSTRVPEEDMRAFVQDHIEELDCIDLIIKDPEEKDRLQEKLADLVEKVYITSSVPHLIEISNENAGKHTGLSYIANALGITVEEIAAFGNEDNDADMLMHAGYGIAVANASKKCKEAADDIVKENDKDGVAQGIYQILIQN